MQCCCVQQLPPFSSSLQIYTAAPQLPRNFIAHRQQGKPAKLPRAAHNTPTLSPSPTGNIATSTMASAKNTPGTPGTPGTDPTGLSVRETEILSKAMLCLKAPPEVDYNKLAGYLGMTNPRSAGNAWGSIKKKLGFGGDAIRSGASTPASGRTASRKRKTGSEDDDEDVDEPTPTKKPRGRAAAGKKGKKSDPEDDYDDVNMSDIPLANSAKKVAAPRGKVVKKTAAKIAKEESSAEEDENSETKLIEDAGEV